MVKSCRLQADHYSVLFPSSQSSSYFCDTLMDSILSGQFQYIQLGVEEITPR